MKAYTATTRKAEFVRELRAHQKAGRIAQTPTGFRYGKGSAAGCALEALTRLRDVRIFLDDDSLYSHFRAHLGIPEWLAMLMEQIFLEMSTEGAKSWPVDFARAIPVGADLESLRAPVAALLLEHCIGSLRACKYDRPAYPRIKASIDESIVAVRAMTKAHRAGKAASLDEADARVRTVLRKADALSDAMQAESDVAHTAAKAAAAAAQAALANGAPTETVEAAWAAMKETSAKAMAKEAAKAASFAAYRALKTAERSTENEAQSIAKTAKEAAEAAGEAARSAVWSAEEAAVRSAYDAFATGLLKLLRKL